MSTTENGTMQVPSPDKRPEKAIFEFRNGKIMFKQKPISFEKQSETLQEIVAFRTMLEGRIRNQESPLTTFPDEHKPLVAKLAHESDKTPAMLTKHIHHELLPTLDEEDENLVVAVASALPLSTVEDAIRAVLVRNNYGVETPLGVKLPNALCVWRWEVRPQHMDWLPKNCREKAETRLSERIQAREDIKVLLEALPEEERNAIFDPKKTMNKLSTKQISRPDTTPTPETKAEGSKLAPESSKKQGKRREDAQNDEDDASAKVSSRATNAQDPEKAAPKDKEKKARFEKERKEKEAQIKSQSLMTKFFTKPKAHVNGTKLQDAAVPGPSGLQSDFERVFKPFALGKDKTLAPQNWFHDQKTRRRRASKLGSQVEIIVLDCEDERDVEMIERQPTGEELKVMTPLGRLQTSLSQIPPSASPSISQRHRKPFGFKIFNNDSVRDLMSQLSEAEISGNDGLVRELLDKLHNRDLFPAKVLCFHTDARPGYFGTWTRGSRMIGPRRPFSQDTLVFDYAYDSGEEWEEEPIGEDVVDDGEDEDGDEEECDSDMDDWLVDDDEEQDVAELSRAPSPLLPVNIPVPVPVPSPLKRKVDDGERRSSKKRKVVVPLVPFAKGPLWESTIGKPEYDPFNSYTIRLFNDTPYPIDPFSFVSNCLEDYRSHQRNVPSNATSDGVFVVPALPPHLTPTLATNNPSLPQPQPATGGTISKKAAAKTPFPDAHILVVVNKINHLHASSLTALVEAIYQDLREHKVTKVAIEAKIREIGEKCRDRKVWVVKPNLMQVPA